MKLYKKSQGKRLQCCYPIRPSVYANVSLAMLPALLHKLGASAIVMLT